MGQSICQYVKHTDGRSDSKLGVSLRCAAKKPTEHDQLTSSPLELMTHVPVDGDVV